MKYYYLLVAFWLLSTLSYSQNLVVTLDTNNVCSGTFVTATVNAQNNSLVTPSSTVNNQNGVMFDVVATNPVTVKSFLVDVINNNSSFEVYSRIGTHVGFENSSTGWNLLGSSTNISAGTGVDIDINFSQTIVAGQTIAFYITGTGASDYIYYDNGTNVGDVLTNDVNVTIKEGVGKEYPFGATFSPRNLVGTIIYEPVLSNITWNVSNSTTNTATFSAIRSTGVVATATISVNTFPHIGSALLNIREVEVMATADQSVIIPGQSATINSSVELKTGAGTTFDGGSNQNGAMLDIEAVKALTITGFSVRLTNTGNVNLRIYMKTGSHVGFEADSNAWTLIYSYSGLQLENSYFVALSSPQTVVPGQTLAFYITRTDGHSLSYTNGNAVGDVFNNDGNIILYEGVGKGYPFGATFTPRVLNTMVHYSLDNPTGTTYTWAPGGETSSSITVSPTNNTTYTLTAINDGCTGSDTASITIGVNSIEENLLGVLKVFPNPTTGFINVTLAQPLYNVDLTITSISGRVVYSKANNSMVGNTEIDITHLATGMYILMLKSDIGTASYRIQKN